MPSLFRLRVLQLSKHVFEYLMTVSPGIRTLVVVFELLKEIVAWGCRNGKFNVLTFQILPLELKVKFI